MTPEHDTARQRFVIRLPEGTGELGYRRIAPDTLDLVHTFVDPALRHRGIAATLVRAAVTHARQENLRIVPTCSYVRRWLAEHPEAHDLVASPAH